MTGREQNLLLIALQILLKLGCVWWRYRVFLGRTEIGVCRPRIRCWAGLLSPAVPSYSWSGRPRWLPDACGRTASASLRVGAARREQCCNHHNSPDHTSVAHVRIPPSAPAALPPPRDDETKQESDRERLERRFARHAHQPIKGSIGPATRLDGLGDAPAGRLNGFRRFLNSFGGLSQHSWRNGA